MKTGFEQKETKATENPLPPFPLLPPLLSWKFSRIRIPCCLTATAKAIILWDWLRLGLDQH
jgi:hypothetical protein